jgi:hypothetical protein
MMVDQANDAELAEAAGAVIDGDIFDHDPSKAEKIEVRNKEPLSHVPSHHRDSNFMACRFQNCCRN